VEVVGVLWVLVQGKGQVAAEVVEALVGAVPSPLVRGRGQEEVVEVVPQVGEEVAPWMLKQERTQGPEVGVAALVGEVGEAWQVALPLPLVP
jgi:hypothetical protein